MRILHVGWGFRPWRVGGLIAYAEDVMEAQARAGHDVSYFCAGRQLSRSLGPMLRRRRKDGVAVFEVLNPGIPFGSDFGSRVPQLDLDEPRVEHLFRRVLARVRPDVVHVQELAGLPSSLIGLAHEQSRPVVMTLQDYFPLCPTLKLYDAEGAICLRQAPGDECRVCCRDGFLDSGPHVAQTMGYELVRLGKRFPRARAVYRERVAPALPKRGGAVPAVEPSDRTPAPPAAVYDHRRAVNVQRLSEVDALVAMSHRVAEIYAELGVSRERLSVLHLTLGHIAALTPRRMQAAPERVRFGGLNVASAKQKGAEVLAEAIDGLAAAGLGGRYELHLFGAIDPAYRTRLEASPAVVLHDFYGPGELDGILDSVDVGLVPSIWEEAYGYVGVEFLAKGIPVIGNALGGIPDYTRPGETGWLNTTADGAGLAEVMRGVIERPAEVLELHRWVVDHRHELVKPMDRHVAELDELYAGVAAGSATNHEIHGGSANVA